MVQTKLNLKKNWALIQAALFYIVWYLAVAAAAAVPGRESLAIGVQLSFTALCYLVNYKRLKQELLFLLPFVVTGSLIDSVPVYFGFITFPQTFLYISIYPLWMIGMWICFSTAFFTSLYWMKDRYALQILFGALGGPLSMYAASALGAVAFPSDFWITMLVIALEWVFVMILAFRWLNFVEQRFSTVK